MAKKISKKVSKKASKKVSKKLAKPEPKSKSIGTKKSVSKSTKKVTSHTTASKKTTKVSTAKPNGTNKKANQAKSKRSKTRIVEPEILLDEFEDDSLDVKSVGGTSGSTALTRPDPVSQYLDQIRKYKLLSREEEKQLAIKYFETGDKEAAERLVTANLRFVVKIAMEYAKFGARLIDIIQEGNVGLMHAVKDFDPYKEVRLITYAVWWIRGYIQEYLMRQYSMVRIGTTAAQRKLFYQLEKQKKELERMGFNATPKQIGGRLGVSEKDVITMEKRMSGKDVSLDQPLKNNESTSLIDLQPSTSEDSVDEQLALAEMLSILKDKIQAIRNDLSERELYILEKRLLADDPVTLQDIGEKYGVTREAVRQMETRVIQKIREEML